MQNFQKLFCKIFKNYFAKFSKLILQNFQKLFCKIFKNYFVQNFQKICFKIFHNYFSKFSKIMFQNFQIFFKILKKFFQNFQKLFKIFVAEFEKYFRKVFRRDLVSAFIWTIFVIPQWITLRRGPALLRINVLVGHISNNFNSKINLLVILK